MRVSCLDGIWGLLICLISWLWHLFVLTLRLGGCFDLGFGGLSTLMIRLFCCFLDCIGRF